MDIIINYVPNGICIDEFNFEQEYEKSIRRYARAVKDGVRTHTYRIRTCLGIEMIRLLIFRKEFPAEDVQVIWNNNLITFDDTARTDWWPNGFCDRKDRILEEFLGWNKPLVTEE